MDEAPRGHAHAHSLLGTLFDQTAQQDKIAEEVRKAILDGTKRFLERVDIKALDEMRKSLELPPEALGAIVELHAKRLAEAERPPIIEGARASREVLPFSTTALIKPGQSAEILARPQRIAFRPERLFVSDHRIDYAGPWWKRLWPWYKPPQAHGAADWLIDDIKIGNRSQFSQAGSIPGDMFLSTAIDSFVSFETAQTAMDIRIFVTYVGQIPTGQRFHASMVGTAAM
jgi:hypothetical protein